MRRAVAVVFTLAACGDALPGAPDAAPPPDANHAAVVKVRYSTNNSFEGAGGLSPAGRRVYFLYPSGTLALVTETDGAGLASAHLPDGGTIVVIDGGTLSIYAGAKGGDEIQVGTGLPSPAISNVLTLHTTLTPHGDDPRYLLHSSCQPTQGGVLFSNPNPNITDVSAAVDVPTDFMFLNCDPDDTQDLLFTTTDFNNVPLAYRYYPSVAFASNQATRPVDANYTPVLSHVVVRNIASRIANLTMNQALWGRYFLTSTDEVFFNSFWTPVDGRVDAMLPIPTPAGATLVTHVTEISDMNPTIQNVVQWGPASAETTVDFGSGLAPLVAPPRIDLSTFTVHWNDAPTATGDPSRADTFFLTMFANGGIGINTINIVGPYTVDETGDASFALPRVAELLTTIASSQEFPPTLVKLRLGEHTARQQLLLTGIEPFPIDGASGQVTYESVRPFFSFPD